MARVKKLRKFVQNADNEKLAKILSKYPGLAKGRTDGGISLLQFAAYCKNQIAMALFRRHKRRLSLFEAISIGDLRLVSNALNRTPSRKNEYSKDGFTPLGLAAYFGHFDIVTFLLQMGADPNLPSKNQYQVTPLHSAVSISDYPIVKLLLKHGVDVNARQMRGVTALHSAAHRGDMELVKLLIEHGADVHAQMDSGQTPRKMAMENRQRKVGRYIKGFEGA